MVNIAAAVALASYISYRGAGWWKLAETGRGQRLKIQAPAKGIQAW